MKIDIFGSCITRDTFEFKNNNHSVGRYFSRTSLISAIHKPFSINKELNFKSNFFNRVVNDDIQKNFKTYVKSPSNKVIIIDLIQERYPLNYYQKRLNTYSPEYRRAKLPVGKLIQFQDHLNLYEHYINKISSLFENYELVIIHEANLAKHYADHNGEVHSFSLKKSDSFFIENGHYYYDLLKNNLNNVVSIKLDGYKGSNKHKWGLSPSHYENDYYIEFNRQLNEIVNSFNFK